MDFQDPTSQDDVIVRRKTRREELLPRIVTEEDGIFIQTTNWDIHPLEVVLKSEAIRELLRKTTAVAASPHQHPQLTESLENTHLEDDDIVEAQATPPIDDQRVHTGTQRTQDSTKDNQREETRDMLRLLWHDGTEFQVPKEVGTLLAELMTRVRSNDRPLPAPGWRTTGQGRTCTSKTR